MTALKLTQKQYDWLLHGINANRVAETRGQSHLKAWDVRRTLTQIFGFGGWELTTTSLDLVREIEYPPGSIKYGNGGTNGKTAWTVVYRAQVRLTIKNPDGTVGAVFEDGAAGDGTNLPGLGEAHDKALKTALSQALKRCAANLGDQFGMGLYNGGKLEPVVRGTFVPPDSEARDAVTPPPADTQPVEDEPDGSQTYVDDQDGQHYAAPPSGGLADDMRGADVHPLPDPPRRPGTPLGERVDRQRDELAARRGPLNVSQTAAQAAQDELGRAQRVNGHAAGQLPPPSDNEPVHVAGARAVERARAQREQERAQNRPAAQPRREPERPAPRPAPSGDPEIAALVEAIVRASTSDHVARLWAESASVRPQGRGTDIRGYLEHAVDDVATAARSARADLRGDQGRSDGGDPRGGARRRGREAP
jgi:hypothetical protein